jgi:hypothetical protein
MGMMSGRDNGLRTREAGILRLTEEELEAEQHLVDQGLTVTEMEADWNAEQARHALTGVVSPKDVVNHPPHYLQHPSGVECIQIVEHMTYNLGNAVKYLWRADHKGDQIEDLRKSVWYIQREIKRLEGS